MPPPECLSPSFAVHRASLPPYHAPASRSKAHAIRGELSAEVFPPLTFSPAGHSRRLLMICALCHGLRGRHISWRRQGRDALAIFGFLVYRRAMTYGSSTSAVTLFRDSAAVHSNHHYQHRLVPRDQHGPRAVGVKSLFPLFLRGLRSSGYATATAAYSCRQS